MVVLQSGERNVAQHGEVLAGAGVTESGVVLAEGDVEASVQVILDPPVTAHGPCETCGVGADAADVETTLG